MFRKTQAEQECIQVEICEAAYNGNLKLVKELIESGANVNQANESVR
jgi:ankyrin repeat protein